MNARYMPTKAAARYTGLSISTLNKLRVIGDGPKFVKCGRRVVYEINDLDSWLASLKRRSTSQQIHNRQGEKEPDCGAAT